MAAKMNMSKLLQEDSGICRTLQPSPSASVARVVVDANSLAPAQAALPKRKLSIRIETQDRTGIPDRVKINYLKPGPGLIATHPAP